MTKLDVIQYVYLQWFVLYIVLYIQCTHFQNVHCDVHEVQCTMYCMNNVQYTEPHMKTWNHVPYLMTSDIKVHN